MNLEKTLKQNNQAVVDTINAGNKKTMQLIFILNTLYLLLWIFIFK